MVITGCLSFSGPTGALRLPNRTTFPAALPCSGAGAIFHHTTANAIYYQFNATSGPILRMPPASGVPAPVPVQVSDDGVNSPTISPLGTLSATPFPDMGDARLVIGLPASGTAPSLANSVFHFEPNMAAGTTTLTVKPFVGGAVGTTWIVDLPNAGTTTLQLVNSTVGQVANLSADGTLEGLTGVQGGTAGAQVTLTTVGGVPTLGTSGVTNLSIAPGGGTTTVTGALTATLDIAGLTGNFGSAGARVILRTAAGLPEMGTSVGAGNLSINPDNGITTFGTTLTVNDVLKTVVIAGALSTTGATGTATFSQLVTAQNGLTVVGAFTLPSTAANLVFASPDNAAGIPAFRTLSAVTAIRSDFASIAAGRLFLGGPAAGGAGVPFFRALATADLPAGTGTVTSVGLTMPAIFSVAGSPVTTSGTLAVTLGTQAAGTVFAGPTTGVAATPTFRGISAVAVGTTDFASILGGNLILGGPVAGGAGVPFFRGLVALDIPTTLNSTTISTQLTVTTITTPAATDLTITPLGNDLNLTDANFLPTTNGTRALGDSTHRWTTVALSTGIIATGAISFDLVNAAAVTLSILNSNATAGAVAHVTIDGGLSVTSGIVTPTTGVVHATSIRGGSGTVFGLIRDSGLGAPVLTSNSGVSTLFLATNDAGGGPGTVSIPLDNFSCGGTITGSSTIKGTTLNCTTGLNTGAGAGTNRITSAGVLNNCDIDGGGTGNVLKILDNAGVGRADRIIGITEVVAGVSAEIWITLNGTTYKFLGAP